VHDDRKIEAELIQGAPHMKFVVDFHHWRLTSMLRNLGFDCASVVFGASKEDIEKMAVKDGRIFVTRNLKPYKKMENIQKILLKSSNVYDQLMDLFEFLKIDKFDTPRCLECNEVDEEVRKDVSLKNVAFDLKKCKKCIGHLDV